MKTTTTYKQGRRGDGDPAQDSEDPVAGAVATAGACVSPSGQQPCRRKEDDENQARQPGGLTWDHFDLEEVKRDRRHEQHEERESKSPGSPAESVADGPPGKQCRNTPLDRVADL